MFQAAAVWFSCWFRPLLFGFLVGSESNEGFQGFGAWKTASFLMGSEGDVRHWGPLPAGPLRPSGPCCLAVAEAPFLTLGGWKTASFLGGLGSKWGPLLAGPLHVSGRCCLVFLSVQAAAVWFTCRFRKQRRFSGVWRLEDN